MVPEEFEYFSSRISKESIQTLLADPTFLASGGALVAEIRQLAISEIPNRRAELYVALHFVSFVEGLDAALSWLRELTRRGIPGPIAAIAAIQVCRRLGAYERASNALRQIYYLTGEDSYVSYFYAQSLAAVGDFSNLAGLGGECLPNLIKSKSVRDHTRWTNLLLDMGLHLEASEFVATLPSSTDKAFFSARMRTYDDGTPFELPTKVVNLDSDKRKWRVASGALARAGYSSLQRHSAVSGRRLPVAAMKRVVAEPGVYTNIGAGAVGCWLSHHAIWESIVQRGDEWTLVLEDDAAPFAHSSFLGTIWNEISTFDLVWVNERMSGVYQQPDKVWEPGILDNWKQLRSWPEHRQGWGTDGYLINRRAAERLLGLAEQVGIHGHVDGQMGAWTTVPSSKPENRIQREILALREKLGVEGAVNSTCLNIPAIKHSHFGLSSTATIKRDR